MLCFSYLIQPPNEAVSHQSYNPHTVWNMMLFWRVTLHVHNIFFSLACSVCCRVPGKGLYVVANNFCVALPGCCLAKRACLFQGLCVARCHTINTFNSRKLFRPKTMKQRQFSLRKKIHRGKATTWKNEDSQVCNISWILMVYLKFLLFAGPPVTVCTFTCNKGFALQHREE